MMYKRICVRAYVRDEVIADALYFIRVDPTRIKLCRLCEDGAHRVNAYEDEGGVELLQTPSNASQGAAYSTSINVR